MALALLICAGGVTAWYFLSRNQTPVVTASPSPSTAPPAPSPAPQPSAQTGTNAACLVGTWIETAYTADSKVDGVSVRFNKSKGGAVQQYTADGKNPGVYKNVERRGSAGGKRYDLLINGEYSLNYTADEKTINYSSPTAKGTLTWKINGKHYHSQPLSMTITPETYSCQGDQLVLYGENYSQEFKRYTGAGTPV